MSEQLSLMQVQDCTLTTTAATFDPSMDFKAWREAGAKLCRVSACVNWWIGDWLNFGERKYGEKYTAAIEATGIDAEVLMQYAYISGAIEISTRVDVLTWSHHREVASHKAKDQKHWLALASENKWSVSQLRQAIRASQAQSKEDGTQAVGFSVMGWATQGLRWFKQRMNEKPVESWPSEQRAALKEGLKPIVEVYERL